MKKVLKKFIEIFYKRKYRNGQPTVRFLFFKFNVRPNNFDKKIMTLYKPSIKNVGKCTYSSEDIYIATSKTSIGAFCSIGMHVVLGHGNHPINYLSSSPYLYFDEIGYKDKKQPSHEEMWQCEPIEIGNDVWIGDGVFVKNGVKIGDGAIIGAKAVVTKDIPPYAIAVGCPAKVIKFRFEQNIIDDLLETKWWELDDDIIKKLPYEDINAAVKMLKEIRSTSK